VRVHRCIMQDMATVFLKVW